MLLSLLLEVRVQSFVFHALYTAYDEAVLPKREE